MLDDGKSTQTYECKEVELSQKTMGPVNRVGIMRKMCRRAPLAEAARALGLNFFALGDAASVS